MKAEILCVINDRRQKLTRLLILSSQMIVWVHPLQKAIVCLEDELTWSTLSFLFAGVFSQHHQKHLGSRTDVFTDDFGFLKADGGGSDEERPAGGELECY